MGSVHNKRAHDQPNDITLIAEGREFQAHQASLAASSDYFDALLLGSFCEKDKAIIELKGVSATSLNHLIRYTYKKRSPLLKKMFVTCMTQLITYNI